MGLAEDCGAAGKVSRRGFLADWKVDSMKWLKKLFGKDFNVNLPHGKCEAMLGYSMGMRVTCGANTNLKTLGYWHCAKHPIPANTKPQESDGTA